MKKIIILFVVLIVFISQAFAENAFDYVIKKDGKSIGLFNKNLENWVLSPEYDEIENINFLFYKIKKNGKYGLFDSEANNICLTPEYDKIEKNNFENFFRIKKNGKYGFWGVQEKEFILYPECDKISKINSYRVSEISKSKVDSKYFDKNLGNLYLLQKNNKIGLFDEKSNKVILSPEYDKISSLRENSDIKGRYKYEDEKFYYLLQQDNKYGLFDSKTKSIIIPVEYESISTLNYEYTNLKLKQNGKCGVYNLDNNKMTIPFEYDEIIVNYATPYYYLIKQNNKWGVYDLDKNSIILPLEYDFLGYFDADYAKGINTLVKSEKNSKYGIYDIRKGNLVLPYEYSEITFDNETEFFKCNKNKISVEYYTKDFERISKAKNAKTETALYLNKTVHLETKLSKIVATPFAIVTDLIFGLNSYFWSGHFFAATESVWAEK